MKGQTAENNLGNEKITSLIAKFAFPAIMANIVGVVYNIADQIFIGQKLGTIGNAATNIAFPLVLVMAMLSSMFGSGGSSNFSLYQGAGEEKQAGKIVGNSLIAQIVSGTLLMLVTLLFLRPLMILFGARGETLELAMEYTSIIAIGMPFHIVNVGGCMLIRADGSPKYAMFCTLIGAVLNIILDPVFIFGFDMGMSGAALATIIGQIISAITTLLYFRKFKSIQLNRECFSLDIGKMKEICILGLPAGLMQLAIMISQIVMNNILGACGEQSIYGRDIPLAVSGVVAKVNSVFTSIVAGISQSCQPIFGYNYGAKNYLRVKETFKKTAVIVTIVSTAAFLLFQLFPHQILQIFQKGNELYLEFGTGYFRIFMFFTFLTGIPALTSNFFSSIGMAKRGIVASLSRQAICQMPLVLIFSAIWGLNGVLYAGAVADAASALLCIALVRKPLKQLK